jgi:hypothetical protein
VRQSEEINCGSRLEAGWILVSVEMRGHHKAGLGVGGANEVEHLFVAVEGVGRPMLGNLGEQAVLDGIPLGSAGR